MDASKASRRREFNEIKKAYRGGDNNVTFKKLKIKLWLQENKKILWLLELIFTIILVFLFGNKIKIPKIKFSSEAIGVTGTLLGAFIGGFFSLAGSVWVAKMQNKAQREVLKKNIIYKPLYDELIKNDRTLKEYPYPTSVKLNNDRPSYEPMIEFCIWTKIKDDSRFLETPKIIAEKMTQLQQVAEDFIAIKQVAIRELNGCWKESQIKFGIEPEGYSSMGEWNLAIVLEPDKEIALEKLNKRMNGLRNSYDIKILRNFNDNCRKNQKILEADCMKMLYIKKQTEMIEILTKYIKYVDLRYEG